MTDLITDAFRKKCTLSTTRREGSDIKLLETAGGWGGGGVRGAGEVSAYWKLAGHQGSTYSHLRPLAEITVGLPEHFTDMETSIKRFIRRAFSGHFSNDIFTMTDKSNKTPYCLLDLDSQFFYRKWKFSLD